MYNVDKIKAIMPGADGKPGHGVQERGRREIRDLRYRADRLWGDIMPMIARYSVSLPCLWIPPSWPPLRPSSRRYVLHPARLHQRLLSAAAEVIYAWHRLFGDALIARRMVGESQGTIKVDYSFAREMCPFTSTAW